MKETTINSVVETQNAKTSLYCTECCNTFVPVSDGIWEDKYGRTDRDGNVKRAELVNDNVIQCSCGQTIGFVATDIVLPGEVVPVN